MNTFNHRHQWLRCCDTCSYSEVYDIETKMICKKHFITEKDSYLSVYYTDICDDYADALHD